MVRRKTERKGGALIGKGTYGCVYRPAMRCNGNRTRRKNTITKYMTRQNAYEEYTKRYILKEVDPFQQFFVYPDELCRPARNLAPANHLALKSCKLADQPTHFLQLPDAGTNLLEFQCPPEDRRAFLNSLLGLCEGLHRLHAYQTVHMDIKPPNIVTRRIEDEYTTRYIDMGLMFGIRDFDTLPTEQKRLFGQPYLFWPFETRYLSPDAHAETEVNKKDLNAFYEDIVRKLDKGLGIPLDAYYTKDGQRLLTPRSVNAYLPFIQQLSPLQRIAFLGKAADVYALGIVFMCVDQMLTKSPLRSLALQMMCVDPFKRPTASQILHQLRDVLKSE